MPRLIAPWVGNHEPGCLATPRCIASHRALVGKPQERPNPVLEIEGQSFKTEVIPSDGTDGEVAGEEPVILPHGSEVAERHALTKKRAQRVEERVLFGCPCMTASASVKSVFRASQGIPLVVGTVSRAPYFGVHLDP